MSGTITYEWWFKLTNSIRMIACKLERGRLGGRCRGVEKGRGEEGGVEGWRGGEVEGWKGGGVERWRWRVGEVEGWRGERGKGRGGKGGKRRLGWKGGEGEGWREEVR